MSSQQQRYSIVPGFGPAASQSIGEREGRYTDYPDVTMGNRRSSGFDFDNFGDARYPTVRPSSLCESSPLSFQLPVPSM
ncbi:uncharacterized protein L199_003623 [Kwoniella botswanensis]|uniref:uncharacterized protein n=1 Tax=Kwoniella botswanensis TaxID=1268659 RepID=UPI00315E010E